MAIKAALFDLDGTLMDTEPQYTIFWGRMARTFRPDVPELEYKIKGSTLDRIFSLYFPEKTIQNDIVAQLDEYEKGMKYEFIPGALDFIKELKSNGVKCAIVTSSNQKKMNSVRLQVPEFDCLFDHVFTSEDFTASKPAPDCYLIGAKHFGVAIDECVVFEDAFNGLAAGMAANMFTVGVATNNPPEAIRDKCSYVIKDFTELSFETIASKL